MEKDENNFRLRKLMIRSLHRIYNSCSHPAPYVVQPIYQALTQTGYIRNANGSYQGPLFLTWLNLTHSMDK